MTALLTARLELTLARRNLWVIMALGLMGLFSTVLTLAGDTPTGGLGAPPLIVATTSLTTLSVYLVPLLGLLLSYDAIAGEVERGILTLHLSYPQSRAQILLGKFLAHLCILATAMLVGLGLMVAIIAGRHGADALTAYPLLRLFSTALALGAAFLGVGYLVSAMIRQSSAAAGLAIAAWLIFVVLYDLGLLGALVADGGGVFTRTIFPWLLVANPADAFRLLNTPDAALAVLASGLHAAAPVVGIAGPLISLLGWPVLTLFLAWLAFSRLEL